MKYILTTITVLLLFSSIMAVSIHDIQYTTNPGEDGTYPSEYEGDIVTTGGIVNAVDYDEGRFFIAGSGGGAWNGIYVYDNEQTVALGDSIIIEAEVSEYWGFTELSSVQSCQIINSNNPIPGPVEISTQQIAQEEKYESMLAKIVSAAVTSPYNEYDEWEITNSNQSCIVSTGFFNLKEAGFPLIYNYPFSSVTGVISYDWGEYKLNPRSLSDLHSAAESYVLSYQEQYVNDSQEFAVPLQLSLLGEEDFAASYNLEIAFDEEIIAYSGYEATGTLSQNGEINIEQPSGGTLSIQFEGDFSFSNIQNLLVLKFMGVGNGDTNLELLSATLDGIDLEYYSMQTLHITVDAMPIGDTLTVVQRPLTNIPALVTPQSELEIECTASSAVSGWQISLQHGSKNIPLTIQQANYNSNLEKWQLTMQVPQPEIYELYDLVVASNNTVTDTVRQAVSIIPQFKENYRFIHITDSHLPTHIFYPDPQSLTDSTETQDLREVIKDINLIHPEFVIFTGDIVNEGELEDFENRRVYTKAQQLLYELEVPVFLTSGNHDIGGWNSTPPPQGTARRNWWRFFGWPSLENPPASQPYYTQNYSFNYGPTHFAGMEAYDNYDSFMYNIYGYNSFTSGQIDWLEADLQQHSASQNRVLFYHFDYQDQIDLYDLDVDLALWGHIHSSEGSVSEPPYDLATAGTCDGNRAYRIIEVENNVLQPKQPISAGWNGDILSAEFIPDNYGSADSLYCLIENQHNLQISDALLKFNMPANADNYLVYNGDIEQIDNSGETSVCYVKYDIPANSEVEVSVVAQFDVANSELPNPQKVGMQNYPNPFNPSTQIRFQLAELDNINSISIEIYNSRGQKIRTLKAYPENFSSNKLLGSVNWNGKDDKGQICPSGVYFYNLLLNGTKSAAHKMLLLK
jgi:hypothetical protein